MYNSKEQFSVMMKQQSHGPDVRVKKLPGRNSVRDASRKNRWQSNDGSCNNTPVDTSQTSYK